MHGSGEERGVWYENWSRLGGGVHNGVGTEYRSGVGLATRDNTNRKRHA